MSINSSYSGRGASYNNNNYNNNSSSSATQRFLADASLVNRSIGQFSDAIRQIQRIQQSASNAASDSERKGT
jgi:hypothetical protein